MEPEKPQLGGVAAVLVFILALLAFTIQSDLTTYIQKQLGFKQPYFLFYVAHSSFALIFPSHLLYLSATTNRTPRQYLVDLFTVVRLQFGISNTNGSQPCLPINRLSKIFLIMFLGLTGPGLMWYISVSLTSISDVTALWNSNAFWAYVFTVKLYSLRWERLKLTAVLIACIGVFAIVYGGATTPEEAIANTVDSTESSSIIRRKSPLIGNLLALMASIWYGLFQVIYKKVVALPNDPENMHGGGNPRPTFTRLSISSAMLESEVIEEHAIPSTFPVLPFGLHPNFFISIVGLMTAITMPLLFPLLHYLEIEKFTLPPDMRTALSLICLASMGLVFNSGFMVLLGIWGPVITSVGGLLTIILVLFSDVLFVEGFGILTVWNSIGSVMIIGSFAMLATEFWNH